MAQYETVNLIADPDDAYAIRMIGNRRHMIGQRDNKGPPNQVVYTEICLDIAACHLNGCPLILRLLMHAPENEFIADVDGIRNNLDRKTGKLMDGFVPRYARVNLS